jgi:diacylglycerol kinase
VNGIRPVNCRQKARVVPRKGPARQRVPRKRQKQLRRVHRAGRRRLISRRIPEIGLSQKSAKEDVLKPATGSNRIFGWINCRVRSFRHASRGLLLLCLTQWNFRVHLVAGTGAVCLACYFRISAIEWLFLIAAIALVLCAEALNTALERTVDLLEPKLHPVARDAKDLGAAAVLIASLFALIVGLIIFGPRVFAVFSK